MSMTKKSSTSEHAFRFLIFPCHDTFQLLTQPGWKFAKEVILSIVFTSSNGHLSVLYQSIFAASDLVALFYCWLSVSTCIVFQPEVSQHSWGPCSPLQYSCHAIYLPCYFLTGNQKELVFSNYFLQSWKGLCILNNHFSRDSFYVRCVFQIYLSAILRTFGMQRFKVVLNCFLAKVRVWERCIFHAVMTLIAIIIT